ncbi:MAG: ribonuclease P protein component [Lewinellaceae bacterium]|nr:ribonuclease P protein component [Saprospiraceae bacterium]MCB9338043.1 ribonuclease P protein component [Lewinellaceae bacterium]
MTKFKFNKAERLKSEKTIGRMFKEGHSFGVYPLRLVWLKVEEPRSDSPVQFTVSVGKKNFKSAVARNRIKRKVREAWRLDKSRLYKKLEGADGQLAFMVLYTAKEDLPYQDIEKAMKTVIHIFIKKNMPPANKRRENVPPLS